jgi:hypothetical protein
MTKACAHGVDYVAALCKEWKVDQVKEIVNETLHELIEPYVYARPRS